MQMDGIAARAAVAELVLPVASAEDAYAVVADAEDVRFLQDQCRVHGTPEGAGATANASASLRLALEEIAVGLARGFLRLQAPAGHELTVDAVSLDAVERELLRSVRPDEQWHSAAKSGGPVWRIPARRYARLRVFRDLWEKGYVVTFGSKFGADFLIYKDDPAHSHAVALIIVKEFEEEFPRVDVVSYCRVAKMVKKQLLFACVRPKDNPAEQIGEQEDSKENAGAVGRAEDGVVYVSLTHALLVSRQEDESELEIRESEREK